MGFVNIPSLAGRCFPHTSWIFVVLMFAASSCSPPTPPPTTTACLLFGDSDFECTQISNPVDLAHNSQARLYVKVLETYNDDYAIKKSYFGPSSDLDVMDNVIWGFKIWKGVSFTINIHLVEVTCFDPLQATNNNCYRWSFAHSYPAVEEPLTCGMAANHIGILPLFWEFPHVGSCSMSKYW